MTAARVLARQARERAEALLAVVELVEARANEAAKRQDFRADGLLFARKLIREDVPALAALVEAQADAIDAAKEVARHVLRHGKLGKQSERRLREALAVLEETP